MGKHWVTLFVGGLGGLVLLAVACAPATEPQAPAPAAEKPAAAQPAEQKPTEQKPAQPAKPTTSVSGIPLDPAAKFGGILRTPHTGEGPTFSTWEERSGNPDRHVYPATNSIIRQQTWGTKEDTAKASYFNVVPDLAKSWEQSSDGLKWTFKLRDGVKWSDGTPFTCADAKWSLDSIRTGKDLRRSPAATHFLAVKDTQCADDMTLVVNMSKPKPGLLNVIAQPYNVVRPKHVYEKNTGLMREKPPTVGTGPFRVKEWLPGEKMTFERRADYWDQPFPYLDGIEIQIMTNAAMDAGLRAGRVDFGPGQGYSGPRLATMRQECKRCVFYDKVINPSISPALMVNHQRPPWNAPLVKDAISYAWDRAKHNQLVQLGDFALPTGGFFLPGGGWEMPYERVKQIPGYNLEDPTGNKEKARQLIARAGYKPGELKVNIVFWKIIELDAPPIIEDLRAVGIQAEALIYESTRAYDAWSSGDFDIGVHSFWYVTPDPDEVLYEHFYTGSDRNYNRYSNPEVDRLIDQMSVTVDPALRKQRAWDVMEIIMREHAKDIGTFGTFVPVHSVDVHGWSPAPGFSSYFSLRSDHIWLDR